MRRTMRTVPRLLSVMAVLGALGFGTRQAWAQARTNAVTCPGQTYGTCASQTECTAICDNFFGPSMADSNCSQGCCWCLYHG